jgi:hypothetical protein
MGPPTAEVALFPIDLAAKLVSFGNAARLRRGVSVSGAHLYPASGVGFRRPADMALACRPGGACCRFSLAEWRKALTLAPKRSAIPSSELLRKMKSRA